jgi:hypothetical protein
MVYFSLVFLHAGFDPSIITFKIAYSPQVVSWLPPMNLFIMVEDCLGVISFVFPCNFYLLLHLV